MNTQIATTCEQQDLPEGTPPRFDPDRLPAEAWAYSPEAITKAMEVIAPFYYDYFECQVRGLQRIPDSPALLVGNHNGLGTVEIPLLLYGWYTHFGKNRPIFGLAHQMVFRWPILKDLLPGWGAVPACHENARGVLGGGFDLGVFPGGDWEASRPTSERGRIDFGGRKGFVRLALEMGVPIVPLTICGAHETMIIASRGEGLARFLGIDKIWRQKTLPLALTPPVLPSRITMECLEPICLGEELAGIEDEEARLETGYRLVTGRMQEKMDELQAEREGFLG